MQKLAAELWYYHMYAVQFVLITFTVLWSVFSLLLKPVEYIALNINLDLVDRLHKKEQTSMYNASYILIFTEEKVADVY